MKEVIEEDPVFKYEPPPLSDAAMKKMGIGPYSEIPALAPTTLLRGKKNE